MTDSSNLNAEDFIDTTETWFALANQAWDDYKVLTCLSECEYANVVDGKEDPYGYGLQMALDAMGAMNDAYRLMGIVIPHE